MMIDGRLNGSSDLQRQCGEVKDETPFRYAHTDIRTQMVVICDLTRYQLDHGAALLSVERYLFNTNLNK